MSVDIAELLPGQSIINPLKKVLADCGLEVPDGPLAEETRPRRWLVRAESSKERLLTEAQRVFRPHPGEWASRGVFFGDRLTLLPESEVYYVFDPNSLSSEWLAIPSEKYGEKIKEISGLNGLNPNTIFGGFEADAEIYRRYPVYQYRRGIVSVPFDVPVESAEKILITDGFLNEDELSSLPGSLRKKILPFLPYKLRA